MSRLKCVCKPNANSIVLYCEDIVVLIDETLYRNFRLINSFVPIPYYA